MKENTTKTQKREQKGNVVTFPTKYKPKPAPKLRPAPGLTDVQIALSQLHERYALNVAAMLGLSPNAERNNKFHFRHSTFDYEPWNVQKGDLFIVDSTLEPQDGRIVVFSKSGDIDQFFHFDDDYSGYKEKYPDEIVIGVVLYVVKKIEMFDSLLHAEFIGEREVAE